MPKAPSRRLAIVCCMDARIDVYAALGLRAGEAHVIRNAGGVVTDDVERSLFLSQVLLGTEHVAVIMHTDCGLNDDESSLREAVQDDAGVDVPFRLGAFTDPKQEIHRSLARLEASRYLPKKGSMRGFLYDVTTGRVDEVNRDEPTHDR